MNNDPWQLAGTTAVVTGGASGIGRAIVLALGRAGVKVAVLDTDAEAAAQVSAEVVEAEGRSLAVTCDTSDPDALARAVEQIGARLGDVSTLVNNAGIIRPGGLAQIEVADWDRLLSINLGGYFHCARAFRPMMHRCGGGAIVHVSSIAALQPTPQAGAYSIAKAGVTMLSKQLALEWGAEGIRSNVVSPGLILTPLSENMYEQPGVLQARSNAIPAGRIGTPEDVAEAVLFLASPRAGYITGADLGIDGGFAHKLLGLIPRAGYE